MAPATSSYPGTRMCTPVTSELRDRLGTMLARHRALAILGLLVCALAASGARAQGAEAYGLSVSTSSSRSSAVTLAGQTYQKSSVIYVFVTPATGIKQVSFYLNDPTRSRAPRRVEYVAQYDFNATNSNGSAIGYSLSSLTSGSTYTITAAVLKTDGTTQVVSGTFKIASTTTTLPPPSGTLRFSDEFNGSSLDTTKWSPWYGAGYGGNGVRQPSALSVSNGSLAITAKMVNGKIESGGISQKANYKYGRYEFRVRTERDPTGTMSGIVMTWPQYQWSPEFTENDMYETGPSTARNPFTTFIHYGRSYTTQKFYRHYVDATQWHTVVMDWRGGSLKIYRDGALVWTLTDTYAIPDVLHHLNVQLDARYTRTLTTPVRMYVDYVRIYA